MREGRWSGKAELLSYTEDKNLKQLNLREYTASFRKEWGYSSNLWKKMKRGWQGRVYSDLCDSVLCNSLDSGIICIMIILVEVGFIVKLHYVFLR